MKQSTGNEPLCVDAKFNRLTVEFNLSMTKPKNNGLWMRKWSYTLGFSRRVKCTNISRNKKKTGAETIVFIATPMIIWKLP